MPARVAAWMVKPSSAAQSGFSYARSWGESALRPRCHCGPAGGSLPNTADSASASSHRASSFAGSSLVSLTSSAPSRSSRCFIRSSVLLEDLSDLPRLQVPKSLEDQLALSLVIGTVQHHVEMGIEPYITRTALHHRDRSRLRALGAPSAARFGARCQRTVRSTPKAPIQC